MRRRSSLISCALGAALADLAWLAAAGAARSMDSPPTDGRYELEAREAFDVTLGRLIECGATEIWFEDLWTHSPGRGVLEASRRNRRAIDCFDRRSIGAGPAWAPAPPTPGPRR
ncbi:MAG TPA: hypothetical protein VF547_03390 [Allosphingosinicella sp.]|jgi:hypothetical protein